VESEDRKIVIIGGGIIGLSVAYHLSKLGITDVLLIERKRLTSGTSWHAAGIVGPLRASVNGTKLASYATELFPALEQETGQTTGYKKTGGFWLTRSKDRMVELARIADVGGMMGMDARLVTPEEIATAAPYLRTDDLVGGLQVAEDGQATPVDICMAYTKAVRAAGIQILEQTSCAAIEKFNGSVSAIELSSGEKVSCDKLIVCAGVWSQRLGEMAEVPVPLQAVEHMYVVTESMPQLPDPFPILRDLDGGIYIKGDTGKLVLGGFEYKAKPWNAFGPEGDREFLELPEDWDQFEHFMTGGLNRLPALNKTGIQHFMNGPESFTPDSRPLLGESPFLKGFFVAAGMNSVGMMSSAGVGKAMAEWVRDSQAPFDLWDVDIARFDHLSSNQDFLVKRMEEAVGDVFATHWPLKQAKAGRDLRRSVLHDQFEKSGAFFGAPTGWERPLWFCQTEEERELCYSFGDQHWWPMAAREVQAMTTGVGVLELSPFTKLDIKGVQACELLQTLCTSDIDVVEGRAIYTQMLNDKGGIEADITVTRFGPEHFRVVSGAATRWKDIAWLKKHSTGLDATVFDMTEAEVVLGIMGPKSRGFLSSLTNADFSNEAFPFSTSKLIDLGLHQIRATRVSFAGELGWELYIPVKQAASIYEALLDKGQDFGLVHVGHMALDSCRLEKGYKHWGHDIGTEDSPLHAGLGFTVDWNNGDFLGRNALLNQKEQGFSRRLMTFAVKHGHPLLLHDEPIYRNGDLVGQTTSGGRGFRTDKSICFASVRMIAGLSLGDYRDAKFEISIAGQRHELEPLKAPAFDPKNERLRG
jgi:glycine cleavage system aminomethyltransferase T/glycine/D-amino acid oxidase-like deaminating enzyme